MDATILYEYIKEQEITHRDQLVEQLSISESTIRRKLKELVAIGLIKVERGGVILLIDNTILSVSDEYREHQNEYRKILIAKQASSYVNNGDVVFIDNGTTVRKILGYLKNKDVTIYTNGYNHISEAEKYGVELNLIPGTILSAEAAIIGEEALMYLAEINFDVAIVGANGFSYSHGVTTPNKTERNLKRFVLQQAKVGIIVVDESKFEQNCKYKVADLDEFKIISKG